MTLLFEKKAVISLVLAIKVGLLTSAFFASSLGWAQSVELTPSKDKELTSSSLPIPTVSNSLSRSVFGQIRFESQQYLSVVPENPQLTRQQFLSARLTALSQSNDPSKDQVGSLWNFDYGADIIAGTFFSQRQTHWMVNEVYASTKITAKTLVAAGRKKHNWSDLEEFWQMSLWQPKYNIDALRPEEQGLTGLFVDYNSSDFQVVGFWTPLFVPTMGAEVREEGGGLKSDSRWFRPPSQSYNLGNNVNSITYKIDTSKTLDLLKNQGAALWARVGRKTKGLWLSLGAADKPVNDLLLTRNIVVKTNSEGNATVQPEVAKHSLVSVDTGYTFDVAKMTLSYMADRPRVNNSAAEWATQQLKPIYAYSGVLDCSLRSLFARPMQVQMGYLKIYGGEIQDIESDGNPADFTLYESRLKLTNTFSTKVQGNLFKLFKKPLNTKIYYFYDWDQKGSLIGSEFQWVYSKDWMILAGADFLGVSDETYSPNGFLNQFRANDRVYGGMSYVF